ncbi:DJ-1 family glyoxalase III [Sunxiuqinia sp. A32]|uniref:DJ-1 family glyoxalase III n=1 Tax=Sunxiuqinia sp. A32 TaxID=3461496 RepID=UPI0040467091
MKKVAIQLAAGFEEIEAITIIDVLRRAKFDVTTISMTEDLKVVGSHQIPVIADNIFTEVDYSDMDMLVLPGGMPGAKNLDEHEGLKAQIIDFNKEKKLLGAICAAPLVFGHLNLLEGKDAVCYPGFEKELTGAKLSFQPTMVSENIITGRGVGAALKFALQIVEILADKEKADQLGKAMLVEN